MATSTTAMMTITTTSVQNSKQKSSLLNLSLAANSSFLNERVRLDKKNRQSTPQLFQHLINDEYKININNETQSLNSNLEKISDWRLIAAMLRKQQSKKAKQIFDSIDFENNDLENTDTLLDIKVPTSTGKINESITLPCKDHSTLQNTKKNNFYSLAVIKNNYELKNNKNIKFLSCCCINNKEINNCVKDKLIHQLHHKSSFTLGKLFILIFFNF